MPARLIATDDRRVLLIVGGIALLLVIVSIALMPTGDASDVPTTYSTGSGGAKAAFLLLGDSGYVVRRWEQSAIELPRDANATLIVAQPEQAPTTEERAAIRRFLERGGRVIATGISGGFVLPVNASVAEPILGITWRRLSSRSPSSITRAAPAITMAPAAYWDSGTSALPLYADADEVRVVKYSVGAGEAIWWAASTPLANAGLTAPGNLEFLLASIGDRSRPVLWDEYLHGHRHQQPVTAFIHSELTWIAAQVTLIVAAVLITYARRSGPTLTAAPETRTSPLEFVRTLGSLYRRAGAASTAVDVAYQQFRFQLTRRLGMSITASTGDLAMAVRDRWRIADPTFVALLRDCDGARIDPTLKAHAALVLTQALSDWSARLGLS